MSANQSRGSTMRRLVWAASPWWLLHASVSSASNTAKTSRASLQEGRCEGNGDCASTDVASFIQFSSQTAGSLRLEAELEELSKKLAKLQAENDALKRVVHRQQDEAMLYAELDTLVANSGMKTTNDGLVEGNSNQFPEQIATMNALASDVRVRTVCETGFNAGHSSLRWLLHSDAQVYSFDIGRWNYSKPAAEFLQQKFPGRLSVMWGDSTQTIPAFVAENPGITCNLVLVDGGHSYDVALADLINFRKIADSTHNAVIMDDVGCTSGCEETDKAWGDMLTAQLVTSAASVVYPGGGRGYAYGSYAPVVQPDTEALWYTQLNALISQYGLVEGNSNELPEQVQVMNAFVSDPRVRTVCETGFNGGHSSLRWLLHSNAQVFSFDIGRWNYSKPAAEFLQQKFPGRLNLIWGDSTQTIPKFETENPGFKCDLIFVDGGHTYDVATADLKNFMRLAGSAYNVVIMDDVGCGIGCVETDKAWGEMTVAQLVVSTAAVSAAAGTRGFAYGSYASGAPSALEEASGANEAQSDCSLQTRIPNLVCANFPQPRLAVCLHGQVRTLSHSLTHRSTQSHFIEAFGGDVVTFAALNIPSPGTDHWYPSVQDVAAVKKALAHLGVSEQNQRLFYPPNDLVNQSSLPTCGHYPMTVSNIDRGHFIATFAQMTNRKNCMELIEADEQASGRTFEYVMLQRADMMWLRPVSPHCLMGTKLKKLLLVGTDHIIFGDRSVSKLVNKDMYADFLSCAHLYTSEDYEETYLLKYLAKHNTAFLINDPALPAYPLRLSKPSYLGDMASLQFSSALCGSFAPDMHNCQADLPQVMFANACNKP